MNIAFDIIVIILSVTLLTFLVLSIMAIVMVLRLLKSIRLIVAKGEQLVDSAEAIGEVLKRHAGATGIVRMLMTFVSNFSNNGPKGRRD